MNKKLLHLLCLALPLQTFAQTDFNHNGINYKLYTPDYTSPHAVVEGYTDIEEEQIIEIPESLVVDGYTYMVTGIGSNAFANSSIIGISIPNTVTSIAYKAFYGCSNLCTITLPESIKFLSISSYAFANCGLKTLHLPASIEAIREMTFAGCPLEEIYYDTANPISCNSNIFDDNVYKNASLNVPAGTIEDFVSTETWNKFSNISESDNFTPVTRENGLKFRTNEVVGYYFTEPTNVRIPAQVNGYEINTIGKNAFGNCSNMMSIYIPETIKAINSYAFSYCKGLAEITIPNSVISISPFSFQYCSNLKSIYLPNSITSIGQYSFQYCSNLKSIYLPNSITTIGEGAFQICRSLKSVKLPSSLSEIEYGLFNVCDSLTNIDIPNSVKSIGHWAFQSCRNLKCIILPDMLKTIHYQAFTGCKNLEKIVIPPSVEEINYGAFQSCTSLTDVEYICNVPIAFEEENIFEQYTYNNATLHIANGAREKIMTTMPWMYFQNITEDFAQSDNYNGIKYQLYTSDGTSPHAVVVGYTDIEEQILEIPESLVVDGNTYPVTEIGDNALANSSIIGVSIPNTVTTIGAKAFANCEELVQVIFSEELSEIGDSAFYNCHELLTLNIPTSIKSIGDYAFSNCSNLKYIIYKTDDPVSGDNTIFTNPGNMALRMANGGKEKALQTEPWSSFGSISEIDMDNVVVIDDIEYTLTDHGTDQNPVTPRAYVSGNNLRKLSDVNIKQSIIVDGVKYNVGRFEQFALAGCIYLQSITIPELEEFSMSDRTFYNCKKLENINLPKSLTHIGQQAFYGCANLSTVTLAEPVESLSISDYAFANCGLKTLYLPESINFGEMTFAGCPLEEIYYDTPNPISCNSNVFDDYVYKDASLNVPAGTMEDVMATEPWNKFSNITEAYNLTPVTRENGLKFRANEVVGYYSTEPTNVIIPAQANGYVINTIGKNAFGNCSNMTSISIPETIRTIKYFAFSNCSGLDEITIPNSVTSIGPFSFQYCSGLKSIDLPNSITSIGRGAFQVCSSLKSIKLPSSLSKIEGGLFNMCDSLTDIDIPNSVESIGFWSFQACRNLKSIILPDGLISIGIQAFVGCDSLERVVIPSNVEEIHSGAFQSCTSLKDVEYICDEPVAFEKNNIFAESAYEHATLHIAKGALDKIRTTVPWMYFKKITSEDSAHMDFNHNGIKYQLYTPDSTSPHAVVVGYTDIEEQILELPESLVVDGHTYPVTEIGDNALANSSIIGVSIPNTVTSIGAKAFANCEELIQVIFSEELSEIGDSAFYNCHELLTLNIPTSIKSIGDYAFYNCYNLSYVVYNTDDPISGNNTIFTSPSHISLRVAKGGKEKARKTEPWSSFADGFGSFTEIDMDNVVVIDDVEYTLTDHGTDNTPRAYVSGNNLRKLSDVNIKQSITVNGVNYNVKEIEQYAFTGCIYLQSITIPELNIEKQYIYDCAFYNCKNLENINLPKSLTSIGQQAFYGCSNLCTVTIPEPIHLLRIEDYAFQNCGLKTLYLTESIDYIGEMAFSGCPLEEIYYDSANPVSCNSNNFTYIIYSNASLYVPAGTIVDFWATEPWIRFSNITEEYNFTAVTRENGLKFRANEVVGYYFTEPTDVRIPAQVNGYEINTIGKNAFGNCSNMMSIYIPETITTINYLAFSNCTGLAEITIPNSVTSIAPFSFQYCSGLKSLNLPNSITSISPFTFQYCSGLESIDLPNSITSIGRGAFQVCSSLKSVKLPSSLSKIEDGLFNMCDSLTDIDIPNSVESVGFWSFQAYRNLKCIILPDGLKVIGEQAFVSCDSLERVVIPSSVEEIDYGAFQSSKNLTDVEYLCDEPVAFDENYIFAESAYEHATLHIANGALDKIMATVPWMYFQNITEDVTTDIEEVSSEDKTDSDVTVYNLNGVKVGASTENLSPGIYILRQGNKVNKISISL